MTKMPGLPLGEQRELLGRRPVNTARARLRRQAEPYTLPRSSVPAEPESVAVVPPVPNPDRADLVERGGQPGRRVSVRAAGGRPELHELLLHMTVAGLAGADLLG